MNFLKKILNKNNDLESAPTKIDNEKNSFENQAVFKSDLENPEAQEQKESLKDTIISTIVLVIIVLSIALPIRAYIAKPFVVIGSSMDPTFHSWDYLIIDETTYNFIRKPERGEVIVFHSPVSNKYFIKRIIGVPGDTIEIRNGTVIVKNKDNKYGLTLKEPYVAEKNKSYGNYTYTLKEGEYFVMGDNRKGSYDSRSWGPLKEDAIVGRPLIRLFPFTQIELFPGEYKNYK